MFPFFQSTGTSLECHDFSDMMDSGLATSSTLRTHGCTSSGPMDLCTFRYLRWSWTWCSSTVAGFSFSQSLPLPSATWEVWLEHLPVKTEAKSVNSDKTKWNYQCYRNTPWSAWLFWQRHGSDPTSFPFLTPNYLMFSLLTATNSHLRLFFFFS